MEEVEKNIAVSEEFVVSYFQTPLFVCIYGSLNTLGFTLVSSELESCVFGFGKPQIFRHKYHESNLRRVSYWGPIGV